MFAVELTLFNMINLATFLVGCATVLIVVLRFSTRKYLNQTIDRQYMRTLALLLGQQMFTHILLFLLLTGSFGAMRLSLAELCSLMLSCQAGAFLSVWLLEPERSVKFRLSGGFVLTAMLAGLGWFAHLNAYPAEAINVANILPFALVLPVVLVAGVGLCHLIINERRLLASMVVLVVATGWSIMQFTISVAIDVDLHSARLGGDEGFDAVRLQCIMVFNTLTSLALTVVLGNNPRQHWRRYAVTIGLVALMSVLVFQTTQWSMNRSTQFFELGQTLSTIKAKRYELREITEHHSEKTGEASTQKNFSQEVYESLRVFNESRIDLDRLMSSPNMDADARALFFGEGDQADDVSVSDRLAAFHTQVKSLLGIQMQAGPVIDLDDHVLDGRLDALTSLILEKGHDTYGTQVLVRDMTLMGGIFIISFMILGVFGPAHASTLRALDALEAEKDRVHKLAICSEHTTKGVVLTNLDGRTVWCNDAFLEMTGYSYEEIVGKSLIKVMRHPKGDMDVLAYHLERLNRLENSTLEILALRKDGSDLWLKGDVTPVESPGHELQFVNVYEDDTEARVIRQRLADAREKAERLALVARHASDGMAILDDNYAPIWINKSLENITGYTLDDLRNADDLSTVLGGPLTNKKELLRWKEAVLRHEYVKGEALLYPKAGAPFWMETSHTPVFYKDGSYRGCVVVHRDITDRKNLEFELIANRDELAARVEERTQTIRNQSLELEKALDRERELNRMQTEFVSMASHEFRTPLTIIDGVARRLEKRAGRFTPDDIRERAGSIRSTVKRMTMLVERTLDASRLSSGRIRLTPETFNLRELLSEVITRHREVAPGYTIESDIERLPDALFGDARLLDNVLTNVVSNAVKYSGENKLVAIRGEIDDEYAVIRVKDYGVGIPEAELNKIFQRFFRASTSTGIPGTGIGLNLVKSLVEMHFGLVSINSVEGKWTEVTIRLPLESPLTASFEPEHAESLADEKYG